MSTRDTEDEPFLATDEITQSNPNIWSRSKRAYFFKLNGILCVFQLVLLILNLAFLSNGNKWNKVFPVSPFDDSTFETAFSPAQSAIQYRVEVLGYESSPFIGEPRPELDQAWSRLLRSTMVMISDEEMRRMNKTSISMKDGSGYLGYLEAHHMLHCVKRLYQFQHQDAYPELRDIGTFSLKHHDHCLEVLRQGIMCNADVSVNTFFWENKYKIKGDRSGARKCTNWDSIQAWADKRTVQYTGIDEFLARLVHTDR
ncbi:hypothetical protein F4823DRAFT_387654 [Ustulina deusta]|nr:hypothetical protein F4823DRAFT_387654 [Ustulina deusta]